MTANGPELLTENIAQAVAESRIVQVVVFAVLFGIALAALPEKNRAPIASVIQSFT